MRAFLRRVNFGSVPFKTSAIAGFCPEGICRAAEKENVDLVIMSTHGRTGLKHILVGSVAEGMMRHAPCAVLVVPSHPATRAANVTKRHVFKAPMPGQAQDHVPQLAACGTESDTRTSHYEQ